jgi:hypothetical protein
MVVFVHMSTIIKPKSGQSAAKSSALRFEIVLAVILRHS